MSALQGFCPPVAAALELYRMLSEPGIDLRQPVSLENQLLTDNAEMDSEVGQSMLQLLQVLPTAIGPCLHSCHCSLPFPSLPWFFLPFPSPSPLHSSPLTICVPQGHEKIPPVLSMWSPGRSCHQEQLALTNLTWLTCVLKTGS